MVPSVTSGEYKNLTVLNWFVEGHSRTSLTKTNVDTINNVMARMQEFAGHNWSKLRDDGYRPYTRLYAHRPSRNNDVGSPYAEIEVGFYLWKKRKHVYERYICLALDCHDMRLSVWGGWKLEKAHPEYDTDRQDRDLKKWTLPQSRLLFRKHLPDAQEKIQTQLEKCLRQFKKSRYYNA